MEGVPLEMTHQ